MLVLVAVLAASAVPAWAMPAIQRVNTNPGHLELNRRTEVMVTAVVSDASQIFSGAFNLERLNPDGTVRVLGQLKDDGSKGDARAGDGIFTVIQNFNEPQTGLVRLRIGGSIVLVSDRSRRVRIESAPFTLPVGVVVPPGHGATIPGPGGTSITVQPNTFSAEVLVGIAPAPAGSIVADLGSFSQVAAVDIIVEPTGFTGLLGQAALPLQIALPLPAGVTDTSFVVGEQVVIDSLADPPGLRPQLIPRAVATSIGGAIVTQPSPLSGIRNGGVYAILGNVGSGFATGTVRNADGSPAAGVVVSNDTNTGVTVTDAGGQYSLYLSGTGLFTLTAFHPFRGTIGTAAGAVSGTVSVDITLNAPAVPIVTRNGVRNGGFERCDLSSWETAGNVAIAQQFGPTAPNSQHPGGVTVLPREGACMAVIDTGSPQGAIASSLRQTFRVPPGARTLRIDYNYVSEEFPEFVGTQFQDPFRVLITPAGGSQTVVAEVTVDSANQQGVTLIGDCGFPGGDSTCGMTDWRTVSVDLSAYAGQNVTVELLFTVTDVGDNIFDTLVFVDNIRFGTLVVDAKVLAGANAGLARADADVLQATEILSQAGLNVRLRNETVQVIANPGALLDTNLDYVDGGQACPDPAQRDGRRTQEEIDLLALSRSPVQTDINLYYIRSGTRSDNFLISGYSISPDEYCNEVNILTNSGLMLTDRALIINSPGILAHEIGHLVISPHNALSALEHGINDSQNFMNASSTPATAVITPAQSLNINRLNAPLIVP
ncbi:MAG TPA: carboxypeptidase-like regulatory domain-containing protein [Candidatus Binatia bacterium]|nr:carboxypeptidase-like regulatory domain-containing protein [Candidatus Binatia bacterium]